MCVTSPPYWGLRDYQVDGQLGLEKTPEEYVANIVEVFRLVRQLLADDGTLWLNLGDTYAGGGRGFKYWTGNEKQSTNKGSAVKAPPIPQGLKPKDLVGIPWMVAKALQAPCYTGKIKQERDRIWLAATIDAEGSICGFTHKRKDNGEIRRGIRITLTNTNIAMLDEAYRIWNTSRQDHNAHGKWHFGKLDTYRRTAHSVEKKQLLIAELYPYLSCKKKQVLLAWNFLEISKQARGRNKGDEGAANKEKSAWIIHALSQLNHLTMQDILVVLFEMQAVMDAILQKMDKKAVVEQSAEGEQGVKLVASRCSTCARLEANGGDCEVGYGVYPACRDWRYAGE